MTILAITAVAMAQQPGAAVPSRAPGMVNGTVSEVDGDLIVGATVKLTAGAKTMSATTDADGRFQFSGVAAGTFNITASFMGFDPTTVTGNLSGGQEVELKPIELKLSTVATDVEVTLPPHDLATEQIHEQEQQRLIGIFPSFFVSYNPKAVPLSAGQKFSLSWANVRDPVNLALVGVVAGIQEGTDSFNGYGQGAAGFGRRYGAGLGNLTVGTFMGGAVLPSLFRQDPRYFYKGTGTVKARLLYAVSRAVICRGDNGRDQPAFASVLGDLSAGAISNAYYPAANRNGIGLTLENGLINIGGDAVNDLFLEFLSRRFTTGIKKTKPSSASANQGANP